jgi:hypothetical protein
MEHSQSDISFTLSVGAETQEPELGNPSDNLYDETLTRGWPAGPGYFQYEWEAERLTFELPLVPADSRATRQAAKRRREFNMQALKAIGNCNPPQCAYIAAQAIVEMEELIQELKAGM